MFRGTVILGFALLVAVATAQAQPNEAAPPAKPKPAAPKSAPAAKKAPAYRGAMVTVTIAVAPVADTPSVEGSTTDEDVMTASGLVLLRSPVDGDEVTHFKISKIEGGTLFQADGKTEIADGSFITVEEGKKGLKFLPTENSFGAAKFVVQASLAGDDKGLGGDAVVAAVTVRPVADLPIVTDATTKEDTITTSGLVLERNEADGEEVTHFRILNIKGGKLFKADGKTEIAEGELIPVADGKEGLKFAPTPNSFGTASFDVQGITKDELPAAKPE